MAQGSHASVMEFAAARAGHEERVRTSRHMNELLRMDRVEDVQRKMAEFARCAHSVECIEGERVRPVRNCVWFVPE